MAVKTKSTRPSNTEVAKLRKENANLKQKLTKYEKKSGQNKKSRIRTATKWSLLGLASITFLIGSIVFYIGFSLIDTGRFMDLASPIAKQQSVQTAIAERTTKVFYDKIDLEGRTQEALPPRINFLAPTVSQQIRQQTTTQAKNVLASDRAQIIINDSLEKSHARLIKGLDNYEGDGTINIQEVYTYVGSQVSNDKQAFLNKVNIPPKYGEIAIVENQWLEPASFLVSNLNTIRAISIFMLFLFLSLAVWVSHKKRRTIIQIGIMLSGLSLLLLIFGRATRTILSEAVKPENQQMFLDIWKILTAPLITQLTAYIAFGLVVASVAWISGNSKSADSSKKRISLLFNGKLHDSLFSKENGLTKFVGSNRKTIQIIIAAILVMGILVIDYTWTNILGIAALAALLFLALETLASNK